MKKLILTLGIAIASYFSSFAQWTTIGNIIHNNNSGNVGIGTSNPGLKLDVNGEIASNTAIYLHKDGNNTVGGALYLDNVAGTRAWNYQLDGSNGLALWNYNGSTWNSRVTVDINGNVGIGTTIPGEKLTVKGNIRAAEVKVDPLSAIPDYVFEPDYKLRSLEDVKAYVDANHHLPEIPSAKEMEKNGISLGDMNMKLLKKIEELTLYLIEIKRENEILRQNQDKINQALNTIISKK